MIKIKRLSDDGVQTLGILTMPSGKIYNTLELAWKNNQSKVSCIPKGKYKVRKRTSAKYGLVITIFYLCWLQNLGISNLNS